MEIVDVPADRSALMSNYEAKLRRQRTMIKRYLVPWRLRKYYPDRAEILVDSCINSQKRRA